MILRYLRSACIYTVALIVLGTLSSVYRHRDKLEVHPLPWPQVTAKDVFVAVWPDVAPVALAETLRPKPSFEKQLKKAAEAYGVPRALALGVLGLENAHYCEGTFCLRKEDSYYNDQCRHYGNRKEMRDLCASSICQMQVMGYNAKTFGLHPADLFDQTNCIEVSTKMLAACWTSAGKLRTDKERIKAAGRCYNGGNINSRNPDAVTYGEKLLRSVVRQYDNINLDA